MINGMIYPCDPKKNKDCKKTSCYWINGGDCFITGHKEYARNQENAVKIERTQQEDEE